MTLNEIAQAANVSPTTVSFVLHNRPGVGAKTRARVQRMLQENGYMDAEKKNVVTGKRTFHFVKYVKTGELVDGNDGFVMSIMDAAGKRAEDLGVSFALSSCNEKTLRNTLENLQNQPVDGVIVMGTEITRQYFDQLTNIRVPMVVVDNHMTFCDVSSVVMNNMELAWTAVKYLYNLGHRNIGYIHGKFAIPNFEERQLGYRAAMEELGLACDPAFQVDVGTTTADAAADMESYLDLNPKLPTAFFCDNDMIAIGCMRALQSRGISIPGDVSIIGIDDISFCTMTTPPLTTMRIPKEQIGERTVDMLFERILNNDMPTEKVCFNGQLVVRGSVAAVERDPAQ